MTTFINNLTRSITLESGYIPLSPYIQHTIPPNDEAYLSSVYTQVKLEGYTTPWPLSMNKGVYPLAYGGTVVATYDVEQFSVTFRPPIIFENRLSTELTLTNSSLLSATLEPSDSVALNAQFNSVQAQVAGGKYSWPLTLTPQQQPYFLALPGAPGIPSPSWAKYSMTPSSPNTVTFEPLYQ